MDTHTAEPAMQSRLCSRLQNTVYEWVSYWNASAGLLCTRIEAKQDLRVC